VSKQTKPEKPNSVADAERVLAELDVKRAACIQRGTDLADERASVALAAHTGDAAARKKLDALNRESAEHASELRSIDEALKAAALKLQAARQHAASEADKANARQVRKVIAELVEHGAVVDDALHDLVEAGDRLKECFDRLLRLGVTSPRYEQLATLGNICAVSALGRSIWKRYHQALAPNQRMTFADLTKTWAVTIERDVRARLGESAETEAA
jgi:hypothetical protein